MSPKADPTPDGAPRTRAHRARSHGPRAETLIPSPAAIDSLQTRVLSWYADNRRDLPWRHTRDPYAILVAEVMLQQTQVERVIPKYLAFLNEYPDLQALATAQLADVLRLWSGLGYNNRAVRLQRCALQVVAQHGATLPDHLDHLEALPGIGPYTARAVLVFAHNADLAAVDANVRRVLTHEFSLPTDLAATSLQAIAEAALPRGRSRDWHNALMDYGALVLTAQRTGISPRTRQSPFPGSRRQQRALVVRLLLANGRLHTSQIAARSGIDGSAADDLLAALERDGLVRRVGEYVTLA